MVSVSLVTRSIKYIEDKNILRRFIVSIIRRTNQTIKRGNVESENESDIVERSVEIIAINFDQFNPKILC